MKVLFTNPGKLGDAFFAAPVMYQFAKQYGTKITLAIPKSMEYAKGIFLDQPWVDDVILGEEPKEHRSNGNIAWFLDEVAPIEIQQQFEYVYHTGYRYCPSELMSKEIVTQSHVPIDITNLLTEKCFDYTVPEKTDSLALHLASSEPWKAEDAKQTILPVIGKLRNIYKHIYLLGTEAERGCYDPFIPYDCEFVATDLVSAAKIIAKSVFYGSVSSMAALCNCIKSRGVVVIPNRITNVAPQWLWSVARNTGPRQFNFFAGNPAMVYSQLALLKDIK